MPWLNKSLFLSGCKCVCMSPSLCMVTNPVHSSTSLLGAAVRRVNHSRLKKNQYFSTAGYYWHCFIRHIKSVMSPAAPAAKDKLFFWYLCPLYPIRTANSIKRWSGYVNTQRAGSMCSGSDTSNDRTVKATDSRSNCQTGQMRTNAWKTKMGKKSLWKKGEVVQEWRHREEESLNTKQTGSSFKIHPNLKAILILSWVIHLVVVFH